MLQQMPAQGVTFRSSGDLALDGALDPPVGSGRLSRPPFPRRQELPRLQPALGLLGLELLGVVNRSRNGTALGIPRKRPTLSDQFSIQLDHAEGGTFRMGSDLSARVGL
jgi:hypothetical protein